MVYKKKISLVIIFFFTISTLCTIAQVGINTEQPVSDLDIVATSSKGDDIIFNVKDYSDKSLLHINNAGRVSTNTKDYSAVRIDLRNDTPDNLDHSLGIGYTDSDATSSKQGSVRYNSSVKTIEFSNGSSWVSLSPPKKRVFVLAQNRSTKPFIASGGSIQKPITNWEIVSDDMGCFDANEGYFIAPREGMYGCSATIVLQNLKQRTTDPIRYDLIIENSATGDALKTTRSYYGGTGDSYLANVCKTLLYLHEGDIVTISIYILNSVGVGYLVPDKSLNTFTVVEM